MRKLEAVKIEIEQRRTELNEYFTKGDYENYSQKSKELDKLIEEYIDLSE